MGSPISSALAKIYLQYLEEMYVKHCMENKDITYYKRYVDVILIIFDQNKTCEDTIHDIMNNIDEHIEFKTSRDDKTINCLDLSINRNANNVDLNIYRKTAYINITIHFTANHPHDHKLAAFNYYINRMITMPITEQAAKQEWKNIITMAHNNGFPEHIIYRLRNKLLAKKDGTTQTQATEQHNRKWVTFVYHGPSIHTVTNLFK